MIMAAKRKNTVRSNAELAEAIHALTLQMMSEKDEMEKLSEGMEDLYRIISLHQKTISDLILSVRELKNQINRENE